MRVVGAVVVLVASLAAAMMCVGVFLTSPMYAFDGGSERVAWTIAAVGFVAAFAFPTVGVLLAWAILTVDPHDALARARTLLHRWSAWASTTRGDG